MSQANTGCLANGTRDFLMCHSKTDAFGSRRFRLLVNAEGKAAAPAVGGTSASYDHDISSIFGSTQAVYIIIEPRPIARLQIVVAAASRAG
jgi:hypothetical protein